MADAGSAVLLDDSDRDAPMIDDTVLPTREIPTAERNAAYDPDANNSSESDGAPGRGRGNGAWAFLESSISPSSASSVSSGLSGNDSDFETTRKTASSKSSRAKSGKAAIAKKKETTKVGKSVASPLRKRVAPSTSRDSDVNSPLQGYEDSQLSLTGVRSRSIFSEVMSLSELQAQQLELTRIQRSAKRRNGTDKRSKTGISRAKASAVVEPVPATKPRGRGRPRRAHSSDDDKDGEEGEEEEVNDEDEDCKDDFKHVVQRIAEKPRATSTGTHKHAKKQVARPVPEVVPDPTPRSRREVGELLPLSALQAQEREWARLRREHKLKLGASLAEREATSSARVNGETIQPNSDTSHDSATSLIDVVELLDEDDDDVVVNDRGAGFDEVEDAVEEDDDGDDDDDDDDDDDFVPRCDMKLQYSVGKASSVKKAKQVAKSTRNAKKKQPQQRRTSAKQGSKKDQSQSQAQRPSSTKLGGEINAAAIAIAVKPADWTDRVDILSEPRTAAETVPHNTTWRASSFSVAPSNVLRPSQMGIFSFPPPFTSSNNRVLPDYGAFADASGELAAKSGIAVRFGKSKQFLLTREDALPPQSQAAMNERVTSVLEKWSPRIRECYERKTEAIVRDARDITCKYLESLSRHRMKFFSKLEQPVLRQSRRDSEYCSRSTRHSRRPLQMCAAEHGIARQLMIPRPLSPLEEGSRLGFTLGRGDTFLSERQIVVSGAIVLAKIQPLSHSTAFVGVKSSVRVEDDPILRYLPYFGDNDHGDAIDMKAYDAVRKKEESDTSTMSSGLENEAHEYILRVVVAECGDSDSVFTALKEVAGFTQPYTEYGEIKKMYDARDKAASRMKEIRMFLEGEKSVHRPNDTKSSNVAWTALSTLMRSVPDIGSSGTHTSSTLSERLASPLTYFDTNLLSASYLQAALETSDGHGPTLGLRKTNEYSDLSETYRDLFCRMCYKYDCHEHGIEHPMPARRVDPTYPSTRYAPVILKSAANDDSAFGTPPGSGEDANDTDESPTTTALTSQTSTEISQEENSEALMAAKLADATVNGLGNVTQTACIFVGSRTPTTESITEDKNVDDMGELLHRRSARSHTRASTLATINFESQHPLQGRSRQRVPRPRQQANTLLRSGEDESEYLDDSHATLVSAKVKTFLTDNETCSAMCWKGVKVQEVVPTTSTTEEAVTITAVTSVAVAHQENTPNQLATTSTIVSTSETVAVTVDQLSEPDDIIKDRLSAPELLLLQKLRYTVGDHPCMIASVLENISCRDVHAYLVGQQRAHHPSGSDACFSPDVSAKNTRKRGRGTTTVSSNNRELLKRTRHQRLKDTSQSNHEYEPCNHDGICDYNGTCSCMKRDHMCEKACSCSVDCPNRFQGCRCSMGNCRTNQCPCFVSMRECNPDLCTTCGATDMPVLIYNEQMRQTSSFDLNICCNLSAQRGLHKKVGVSVSATHGWGAFALEPIRKGEFIYEYTGAIISHDEAERRGSIYDKMNISFLFDLNEDAVVDAVRKGNKSKFANHARVGQKCHARVMRVGGEHRISVWACADIHAGEELFFDYGYHGESAPVWSKMRITGSGKGDNVKSKTKGNL